MTLVCPTPTPPIIIRATVPCVHPPAWAFQQRALFAAMNGAIDPFLAKYTDADGALIWKDPASSPVTSRDGADDFYESFYNWPLLYLLGGDDRLLDLAHRHWEAVTVQLAALGLVENEFERGYDQFHLSEGSLFLYFLCLADPSNPRLAERLARFAGLYLGDDPAVPNYDAERRLVRAPHNGAAGPRPGLIDGPPNHTWTRSMVRYGLPLHDVPGITSFDDLKNPDHARTMGEAMGERMGRGDIPANLGITSLMTMTFLLTGDTRYIEWIVTYLDAWAERAAANGNMIPDNVGLSGEVGEYHDGAWFGGHYGWTWPHGFYNISASATVAASNATLLTGDTRHLDIARRQIDATIALGEYRDATTEPMSLAHHWAGILSAMDDPTDAFLVPYRHGPDGWFDFQPIPPIYPLALWNLSGDPADWTRVERLRERSGYDWAAVLHFRGKEDAGHEEPWVQFLSGALLDYPETVLSESYAQVLHRARAVALDDTDLTTVHIHHWQDRNPVTTEALIQLTLGAPQVVYYGGLLHARVRYFDAERRRPGLPADVAALVTGPDPTATTVRLVNLHPVEDRRLLIQAGAFAEHRFDSVSWDICADPYPKDDRDIRPDQVETTRETAVAGGTVLDILLPAGTEITLHLAMTRHVHTPTARTPWDRNVVA